MTPAAPAQVGAPGGGARPRHAVFVGRLVEWKGIRLAVAALDDPAAADWTLEIVGSGPAEGAVRAEIARRGLEGRVALTGQVPREEVLQKLSTADAFLFPSFHDGAAWVVAEAVTAGCPVICLDRGGPQLLAGDAGIVLPVGAGLERRLARALAGAPPRSKPTDRWGAQRLPEVVDGFYRSVTASPASPADSATAG